MSQDQNNSKTNAWLFLALVLAFPLSSSAVAGPIAFQFPAASFAHLAPQTDQPPSSDAAADVPAENTTNDSDRTTDSDPAVSHPVEGDSEVAKTETQSVETTDTPGSTQETLDEAIAPVSPVDDEPRELSVEPLSPLLPKDRPSWIDLEPQYDSDVHRFVVVSLSTPDKSELPSHLDAPLEAEVQQYVNLQLGEGAGDQLADRLSAAFIRSNFVDDNKSYIAELQTSGGPHFQQWVMVEVTAEQRQQLRLWYNQALQRQRILPLSLGIAGLLSLVGLANLGFRRRSQRSAAKAGFVPPVVNIKRAADRVEDPADANCAIGKKSCFRGFCSFRRMGVVTAIVVAVFVALMQQRKHESSDGAHREERVIRFESSGHEVDIVAESEGRSNPKHKSNQPHSTKSRARTIIIRSN